MKKNVCIYFVLFCSFALFSADYSAKGNIVFGGTAVEKLWNQTIKETETDFGEVYLKGDFTVSTKKVTAGAKIYYRVKKSDDTRDLDSDAGFAQKLDIKRAYLRFRPFGDNVLEISGGKLYSYYLTGNYFQLAEIYTGSSRWGKTGVGVKSEFKGFTLGAAIPVTESYLEFQNYRAFLLAAEYDFSTLNENVPLSLGATFGMEYSATEKKGAATVVDKTVCSTVSLNFAPKIDGFVSKLNATLSCSIYSEPFVANSTFKKVTNYATPELAKAHFASVNFRSNFGAVQLIAESEAGHSSEGTLIPLYAGAQLLIPIVNHLSFKPRFFYYAALDTDDNDANRMTFQAYPRLWIAAGQWSFSLGTIVTYLQVESDAWRWLYSVPFYVEYKIGK
ncbi:MAG: hypothetical protein IJS09_01605 [Treponema sp.]|nr:hypothetical protein [Treponema sp.]